jgi:SNF2 family DNA or RNA helicase
MAEDEGKTLTISTPMDRITRFQQICGGFFPFDEESGGYDIKPISGKNPKLKALVDEMEVLRENGEKVIIWARFRPEIELIRDTLNKKWKGSAIDFYGGTPKEERKERTRRFQEDPDVWFMVSSQAVGARGQTWTAATQERYYSQTFSYEDRAQSEDRAHRKGQTKSVGYRDYLINVQAEKMISVALTKKKDVADMFSNGIKGVSLSAPV